MFEYIDSLKDCNAITLIQNFIVSLSCPKYRNSLIQAFFLLLQFTIRTELFSKFLHEKLPASEKKHLNNQLFNNLLDVHSTFLYRNLKNASV